MPVTQPSTPADPMIALAERQLAMLGELAHIAMEVSRGYGAASVAASHAVEVILADEYWQPETGRARALAGARDAADGFQKVSRVLRLTLKLEVATAEMLRDLRAGVVRPRRSEDAGEDAGAPAEGPGPVRRSAGVLAGSCSDEETRDLADRDAGSERLVEFDRPDRLFRGPFRETVDGLCADLGVAPDWTAWSVGRPAVKYQPLAPRPPGSSECRPPGGAPRRVRPGEMDRLEPSPP